MIENRYHNYGSRLSHATNKQNSLLVLGHKASEWFCIFVVMSFIAGIASAFSNGIGLVLSCCALFCFTCCGIAFCKAIENIAENTTSN